MKQGKERFDIPIPLIIAALFISFPVGVILAVLRAVSTPDGEKKIEDTARKAGETVNTIFTKAKTEYEVNRKNRQNQQTRQDPYTQPRQGGELNQTPEGTKVSTSEAKLRKRRVKAPKLRKTSAGVVLSWIAFGIFSAAGIFTFFDLLNAGSLAQFFHDAVRGLLPLITFALISYVYAMFFKGKVSDYNVLRALIADKESVRLSKIAAMSGKKEKKICRDLQHLINKGEFGESAYIDLTTGCFMRYPEAVPDTAEYASAAFNGDDPVADPTEPETAANEDDSDKDRFRAIILDIRRLNDEIRDFVVSEKIYRIEEHMLPHIPKPCRRSAPS